MMYQSFLLRTMLWSIGFALLPLAAHAQTEVTVSDATELQAALTDAETDTNDTVINLEAGNYSTTTLAATFVYDSSLEKNLTLQGAGMGVTILDGADTHQVLSITHTGASGNVVLMAMTIQNGSATSLSGGGLFVHGNSQNIELDQMEISQNTSFTSGQGGGFYLDTLTGNVTINRSLFADNQTNGTFSDGGGGFIFADGVITVTNSIFYKNLANEEGGGLEIEFETGTAHLINNTFFENTANDRGGGLFIDSFGIGAETFLFNNIFFGNVASAGAEAGEDIFGDNVFATTQPIDLFNNIFTQACFTGPECDPTVADGVSAGNNLDQDPLLEDPAGGDFNLGDGSPAVDAGEASPEGGLPTPDFASTPRPLGTAPDLGALEALPLLQIDPTEISFGDIGSGESVNEEVTLSNQGIGSVAISAVNINDSDEITVDDAGGATPCGPVPFTLAGGDSCTVLVVWNPTSFDDLAATIEWVSDDPENPSVILTLTGNVLGGGDGGGCALNHSARTGQALPWVGFLFMAAGIGWVYRRRLEKRVANSENI